MVEFLHFFLFQKAIIANYNKESKPDSWLESWSKQSSQSNDRTKVKSSTKKQATISESALKQLQQLYGKQNEDENEADSLPGSELDIRIAAETNKLKIVPNDPQHIYGPSRKEKEKITAELSDVSLD